MATEPAKEANLPLLGMDIRWIYGPDDFPQMTSKHPLNPQHRNIATHRIEGTKFSGKSALGENITANYRETGSAVYDFYSAKDNEGLAALDPLCPFRKEVVLVHDDTVRFRFEKENFETLPFSKLKPWDTPDGKWYVTCKRFFPSEYSMYEALYRFTQLMEERAEYAWNRVDVIFIREAQEWLASRTKTNQAETKKEAQDEFIDFHNQTVHSGFALVLDSQRDVEVAKNLRELSTYTYYKKLGNMEIPEKIYWIMGPKANYLLDTLRIQEPDQFLIWSDNDCLGMGTFEYPPWHINRGSGLMRRLGIHPYVLQGQEEKPINWVEAKEQEPRRRRPSNYAPVQHDRRKVVDSGWERRIEELTAQGIGPKPLHTQLTQEGFTGSLRTVEAHLYKMKLRRLQNSAPGTGSS